MEVKTNIELNVLYCTDNETTEDQIVLKIMNALQDGESQIVVSPANQHSLSGEDWKEKAEYYQKSLQQIYDQVNSDASLGTRILNIGQIIEITSNRFRK